MPQRKQGQPAMPPAPGPVVLSLQVTLLSWAYCGMASTCQPNVDRTSNTRPDC